MLSSLRRDWLIIAAVVVLSRLAIWLVGWASTLVVHPGSFFASFDWWALFWRWDSNWYYAIANCGYGCPYPNYGLAVNYYPLYPLLARLGHVISGGLLPIAVAGYIISNVSLVLAAVWLYRLTQHDFGLSVGRRVVLYLMLVPAGFFLSIFYSEGLFLAATIGTLYFARRGRWWLAGIMATAAVLTRPVGMAILIPLAIEYWAAHKRGLWRVELAAVACPILVAVAAAAYFQVARLHAAAASFLAPIGFLASLRALPLIPPVQRFILLAAWSIGGYLAFHVLRRRLPLSYRVYTWTLLAVYAMRITPEAIPRYMSVVWPLYITAALIGMQSPRFHWATIGISMAIGVGAITLFVNGYWFP